MAVIAPDVGRFGGGPGSNNAENQRVSTSKHVIKNVRPAQPDNGDGAHAQGRGSFTKGLRHDPVTGLVSAADFAAFKAALAQPRNAILAAIDGLAPLQGAGIATRKWVNPTAGHAFGISGGDPQQYAMPAPPAFGSAGLSFEMLENYWMALLRDVPFSQYESSPLAAAAAAELSVFHAAAVGGGTPLAAVNSMGKITPSLLFRGLAAGDQAGPYLSQFLINPVPFGVQGFEQRNRTLRAGQDFMTTWSEWLQVQNGAPRDFVPSHFDETMHYMRNGRDLSQWVHIDVLFQGYFNACLILLQGSGTPSAVGGGIGAARSSVNPYPTATQDGFGVLGDPAHIAMVCEVAPQALKAVWFQKWFVHLRLRPEVYAARVDHQLRNPGSFGLPADLLGSHAVGALQSRFGSALLPMAFPEGSPLHPAYGAGHATVAGACVTILKALFDGAAVFPNPVDVLVDGQGNERLVPSGETRTIGGELNKLASNVALGRNVAGVHWRTDGTYSLRLGEEVAIDLLRAYARSYLEFAGGGAMPVFRFQRFDGGMETISA